MKHRDVTVFLKEESPRGILAYNVKILTPVIFILIALFLFLLEPYTIKNYPSKAKPLAILFYTSTSTLGAWIGLKIGKAHKKKFWSKKDEFINVFRLFFIVWCANGIFSFYGLEYTLQLLLGDGYHAIIPENFLLHGFFYVHFIGGVIYFIVRLFDISSWLKSIHITPLGKMIPKSLYKKATYKNKVLVKGRNNGEELTLSQKDLIYIKSEGHYVEIHYLNIDNIKESILLRATLKEIEDQVGNFSNFYRCHKSYIVNSDFLVSVTSDFNKSFGHLNNKLGKVSISKNMVPVLKEKVYQKDANKKVVLH